MRRASTSRIPPESAVLYRTEKGWAGIAFPVLGAIGPVGGVGGGGKMRGIEISRHWESLLSCAMTLAEV
jgi:hypothetical protein